MPSWNEAEYVSRANEVARQFVVEKKPLNDLCEKLARDEAMNPDEIRTLVRLSNVAAFQHLFKDKQGDKMVEFDVGNPESVIQRIQSSVDDPPQPANIHNDKLAQECPDMMREIRLGRKFDEAVKLAHEEVPERPMKRDLAVILGRKLAAEFDVERRVHGNVWEQNLRKLAQVFRRAPGYGQSFGEFEKAALAEFGLDAVPELTQLREDARLSAATYDTEKVAHLQERHVHEESPELATFRVAVDARHAYVKMSRAKETLETALKE